MRNNPSKSDSPSFTFYLSIFLFTLGGIGLIIGLLYAWPVYSVWTAEQQGKAMLAKANYSKEAQVADAKAKLESAKYLKQAADEIESSLTPAYLTYLKIQAMEHIGEQNERAIYFCEGAAPQLTVKAKDNTGE